jgi:hypothetical protein
MVFAGELEKELVQKETGGGIHRKEARLHRERSLRMISETNLPRLQ